MPPNEVSTIKQEYANKPAQQAAAMLKVWQSNGNKATGKQRTNVTKSTRACRIRRFLRDDSSRILYNICVIALDKNFNNFIRINI